MSGQIDPPQPDFEEASVQLNQGLRTCEAVVRNYRAMLGNPGGAEDSGASPETPEDPKLND